MNKLVVYCHGYGSSAKTDKVQILRDAGLDVHAWDIDIDPRVSIPALTSHIDSLLVDYMNRPVELVFVGTSLGAWYACILGKMYDARSVLVNPAYDPARLLPHVGASAEMANRYGKMVAGSKDTVVIALDDELIDFADADFSGARQVVYSAHGGHRFNGEEFNLVIGLI